MAYATGEVIKTDDLGKTLTNGNDEIANYNIFAITVSCESQKFTFPFSRSSTGTKFCSTGRGSGNSVLTFHFTISLSGNTFSVSAITGHSLTAVTCSISQIRAIG